MNDTQPNVRSHVHEHSPAHYTAQQIAEAHDVSEVTVRTRWFNWLCKVAPAKLLKSDKSYSELAKALFDEFASVNKKERPAWVADAKTRYSSEWGNVGIIDCEVMPENVGHALALLQTNNDALQQSLLTELQDVESFVDQLGQVEANFSEAELQNFQVTGAKRGIVRFKIEAQAEAETLNALRQRRMGGNQ